MKVHAILAAAGTGKRFRKSETRKLRPDLPKQFFNLQGKPLILYSLLALQKCSRVDSIIISADPKYFNLIGEIISKNKITKFQYFAEGGETRYESVWNAFSSLEAERSDLVVIHDAARPMIDSKDIDKILSEARKRRVGGIIYGRRITDTVKREFSKWRAGDFRSTSIIEETIDREFLWTVQTPQVFKYGVLKDAYRDALAYRDYPDESSVVESAGYKVRILKGKPGNIKITTPEDLEYVRLQKSARLL
jgi:2-C-methyl-D-erythritol 4-phosphate cytidylyltransferase